MARLAHVAAAVLAFSASSSYYSYAGSGSTYEGDVITAPGAYALPSQYANATPMALLDVGGGHMTFHWFTPATIDSMYLVYVNGSLTGHAFGITNDYTLEGLVCDTTYVVVVVDVVNANLVNVLLAATTVATAPATPPSPVAVHVDSGYVNISIRYPKDTGGRPIESMVEIIADAVDRDPFVPVFTQFGPQSATLYKLVANTEYFISVRLKTPDVTYPSLCPMPVLVAATAGLVQLRLTPPLDTGGSDIFGYHIYVGVNGTMVNAAFTSTTEAYLYESAPGEAWVPEITYDIQVIAMNELALCPSDNAARRSDALRVTIPPAQVPSSRYLDAYLVSAEASRLTLQGATPLGVYVTTSAPVGGATTVFFPTTGAVVATIAGLNASTTYAVALQLLTSLGNTTERSNVLQATTGLPATPAQTTILNVTASTATVAWVYASDTGGGALTEYQVQVNASRTSVSPTWLPLPPSPVATISGLAANTTYRVAIQVRNIFGLVSPAAFVFLTTANATVPGPPSGIAIASISSTALQLTWRPPEDTGGRSDALIYTATVLTNDNVIGSCNSNSLHCTLYELQPSTYFTVTVVASNAFGAGAASAPITVLTSAVTPPSAVLNLTTTVESGGVITVVWNIPLDSGDGSTTLQYTVARNGVVVGSVSGATTYTDCGGIRAGATYEYAVMALNSVGAGPSASTTTVASVMQPPMTPSVSWTRAQATGLTFAFALSCDTGGTNVLWNHAIWYPLGAPMPLSPMLAIPSTASSFAIAGLTPSVTYTVVVWTSNYAGKSNLTMVTATTTTGLPGLPSVALLTASSYTLSLSLWPPTNFTEDVWQFQATLSLAGRVVRNTTVQGSAASTTVWSLSNLDAATTYDVALQVVTPQGVSPVATAQYATLLDLPGVASFTMPAVFLTDGSNSTTLTLERLYGARGQLVVPLTVATAPAGRYLVCNSTGSATMCTFSATAATTPSITFGAGNVTHTLTLETWNSLVVTDVPHLINITLPPAANASTTATVYLYGSPGSIQAPATVVLYENVSTASIVLTRVGGVSGFLNATVAPVNGTATVGVDVGAPPTSVNLAPGQTTGVISLTNITRSLQYNPNGRKLQLALRQVPVGNVPPAPAIVVNIFIFDDPSVVKVPMLCGTVVLTQATGTTLTLQWLPPAAGVTPTSVYRIFVAGIVGTAVQSPTILTSSRPGVVVYNLAPSSNYVVQVALANAAGAGPATPAQMFSTTPPTPASTPQNATAVNIGGGVATLTWAPPNDTGGYAISGYVVSAPRLPTMTLPVTKTYTAYNLSALTSYTFAISAVTAPHMPTGMPVFVHVMTTAMELPSTPPPPIYRNATGGALSFALILPLNMGGGPVLDASLYLTSGGASPVRACSGLQLSCTVYGLAFNTAYTVYTVVTNAQGPSLPSSSQMVSTAPIMSLPSAPATPVLVRVSGGTVWLSWTPPSDFGGTPLLTGYQVLMRANIVSVFGIVQWTASTVVADVALSNAVPPVSQINLTGLTNDTLYAFSVVALNPVSACRSNAAYMPSPELLVRTLDPTAPTPPTSIVQVSATGGAVTIAWSRPADNGGSPVTNYTVVRLINSSTVVVAALPATLQSYQVVGLAPSTAYIFQVAAVNIVGTSGYSDSLQATTSAPTPPTPPQSLQVTAIGGGLVALAWQPPTTLLTTAFFTDVHGLSNGTTYTYSVSALNAQFEGGEAAVSASTLATPDVPQPPVVSVLVVTGGMLLVQVQPPENLGGQPLRALSVQVVATTSGVVANVTTTETNSSFYGLSAATSYDIVSSVSTSAGSSAPSTVRTTTLSLSVPSMPLEPQQQVVRGGSVDLWLRLPLDRGGGSVDMHVYQLSSTGSLVTHVYKNTTQALMVTIPGLLAESLYQFWTTAINAAGESVHSPVLNVMTPAVSAPGLVTGITAPSKSYRTISLSWAVPADTGGDVGGILGYNVTVSSDAGLLQSLSTSTPSIRIDGLVAATTFTTDDANPGALQMASVTISVREDQGTVTITVLRTNGAAGDVSCNVTVTPVTALLDIDFALPSTTSVEFPDGITSQSFSVPIFHNTVYNDLASFMVTLTDMTSATGSIGANASCTVYLLDAGDDGEVAFLSSVYTLNENATNFELALVRTGGFSRAVTVTASVLGDPMVSFGTPTVVFEDGQTSAMLVVRGIPNDIYDMPYRETTIQLQIGAGSLGRLGSLAVASLRLLDEGDVSGANDTGLPPVLVNATGGLLTVAVQAPFHTGGASQSISYYALTTYQLPSMAILDAQNQTTPTFFVGGLRAQTSGLPIQNYSLYINVTNSTVATTETTTVLTQFKSVEDTIVVTGLTALTWYQLLYTVTNANGTSDLSPPNAKNFSVGAVVPFPALSTTICGLTQNTTYTFKVIAYNSASYCYGSVDKLEASLPVTATTSLATLPLNQSAPLLQEATGGTYLLYQVTSSGPILLANTSDKSHVAYGLAQSTSYQFQLVAQNAVGLSAPSPIAVVATTSTTAPTAPRNLRVTNTTGGAVTLAWDPVLDTGGQPVNVYFVYRNGARIGQATAALTYIDAGGLTASTTYSYIVVGFNGLQYGDQSSALTATTSTPTVPSPCTAFNVALLGGEVSVNWSPGADTGGVPVLSYLATLMLNNATIKAVVTATPTFHANFLLSRTNYTLSVQAVNQVGASANASVPTPTTQLSVPGDISTPPVLVSAFGGNATFLMTVPLNTGGGAQLSFVLYQGNRAAAQVSALDGSANATAYGLNASTAYTFTYACFNSLGLGGRSPSLSATTLVANAPGPIALAPRITAVTSRTISCAWQAPLDTGGSVLLVYELRAVGPSGAPNASAIQQGALALTLSGLQYDTAYTVQARAWSTNQTASGPWSPPVTVSTASGSPGVFSLNASAVSVIKNATVLSVVLRRAVGTIGDVTVAIQAPNTAHLGSQFVLNASRPTQSTLVVAVPDGTASVVVPIGILNDGIYRAVPSTFVLQLVSATGGASIGANNATMTVTLLDAGNAGKVRFAASYYDVADTVGTVSIPVLRYSGASTSIQVLAKTATNDSNPNVAAPGINYRLPTTPLEFGDNQLTPTLLNITIRNTKIYSYPSLGLRNASSAPSAPPAPSVVMVTGGAVQLHVQLPINRGSAVATISKFSVTTTNVLTRVSTTTVVPYLGSPSVWIGGLQANATYTLSLAAAQSAYIGYGPPSPNVTFTTGAPSLATAPMNVAVASATGGALTLQWDLPLDAGGVPILSYRVRWTDASNAVQVAETGNAARTFAITGLVASRAYPIQIQCYNAVPIALTQGWGPYSAVASLSTTNASLPGTPVLSSTPTATTGGSITVTWSPPLDTGGAPILGYHVFFKTASASSFAQANGAGIVTQTRFAVAPLTASTSYSFLVVAENAAGPVLLPGVFNVSATATSVATSMDCRQVLTPGNAILLGPSLFTVGGAVTSSLFTVTQANAYATQLRVPAYRVGAPSNVITAATTYPTNPGVAPAPVLTHVTGGAMYATASSPADTGGIPVTGFQVLLINIANGTNTTLNASAVGTLVRSSPSALQATAPIRIQNLSPTSLYAVAVVAVNAVSGCSSYAPEFGSATSFTTTSMSTPGPPEDLGVVLATGAGLSMVWSPPFDTGGASIDSYTLQMQDAPTSNWTSVYTGPTPAYRMAGLETSTTSGWRLRATNAVNTSLWSTPWNFSTTGPSVPGPCIAPYNVTTTGGRLEVAWAPPADNGGAPILSYLIAHDNGAGGPFTWFAVSDPFYIAYGLSALTTYRFKVLAKNMIGSGEQSPIAFLTSGRLSSPQLPAMPTVVATTGGAVSLQLSPPLDLGGVDPATLMYRVFANGQNVINVTYAQVLASQATTPSSPATSRRLTAASPSSSVVVAGLDPNTVYQFGVAVVTPVGTSAPSALNAAVTQLPTAPIAPAVPVLVVAYGGSLQLSWLSPVDEGGSPVTSFALVQLPNTTVCEGLIWTCIVPNLAPNTAYSFYVVAANAVGSSPSSPVLSTKTLLSVKPTAPRNAVVLSVAPAGTSALVAWDPPMDLGGLALSNYRVAYTNVNSGLGQTVVAGSNLNATLVGLSTGTIYSVTLTAVNIQLDESPSSYSVLLTTPSGNGAPTAPTIACASSTSLGLVWMPVQGADRYALYRGGALVATVSAPHFTDASLTPSTAYSYTLKSVDAHGAESVGVTASLATTATSDNICTAAYGYVTQNAYGNNQATQWTIAPSVVFANLRLEVLRFDTECDHDVVRIEQFPFDGSRVLWSGGCTRLRSFSIWSDGTLPVRITLRSDASVTKSGFTIRYIASTDAPLATAGTCPTTAGAICSEHGRCRTDGTCRCNLGFTGEDCSNRLVCCVDPNVCNNDICRLPSSQVLVVDATAGDDALGTGAMMNTSEVAGTAAKPFATLARALQVATNDTTVFVYPGNYGASSCGHVLTERRVTITSLRGSNVTILTCTGAFGLDVTRCTLAVTGVTLERATSASHGAGLAAHGSLITFTDVVLRNTTTMGSGGGVYLDAQSVMTLNNSIIANATARLGGGIYVRNSQLFLAGAVITTNAAGYGAGIFTQDTGSIVGDSASVLSHNTASVCGGGLALNGSSSDLAAITNVPITANAAANGGGACVLGGYAQIAWARTIVLGNFASNNGGGLYLAGDFVFNSSGSTFSSNHALGYGGGMYFLSASGAILADDALTVVQNQARAGGGVYTEDSRITLTNLEAALNVASDSGGGIMGNASGLQMLGANIVGNSAAVAGGGMHFVRASVVTTSNVVVADNRATDGAGVSLDASALSDAFLVGNTAMRYGGGVFLTAGATLTGCTVHGCSASVNGGASGGGVAVLSSTLQLALSPIISNTAATDGGGLFIANGAVTVITACISQGYGGGVALDESALLPATPTDVAQITDNTAIGGGGNGAITGASTLEAVTMTTGFAALGGALYVSNATASLQRLTLDQNTASTTGGGAYIVNATVSVAATTVSNNHITPGLLGGGLVLINADVSHSSVVIASNTASKFGGLALGGVSRFVGVSGASTVTSNNVCIASVCGNGANIGILEAANATIAGVDVSGGRSFHGGSLYVDVAARSAVSHATIRYSVAVIGGALYAAKRSSLSLTDVTLAHNRATRGGGAIRIAGESNVFPEGTSVVTVSNVTLFNNSASAQDGGAVWITRTNLTGTAMTAFDNAVGAGNGGAFCIDLGSNVALDSSTISKSRINSNYNGAAFNIQGGSHVVLSNSLVSGSVMEPDSVASLGGLLYIKDDLTSVIIEHSTLQLGYARSGGAIYIDGAALAVINSTVSNCTATEFGGGLFVTNVAVVTMTASLLENCTANYNGGGVNLDGASQLALTTTVVRRNTAQDQGGAVFLDIGINNALRVESSLFEFNLASGLGSALFGSRDTATTIRNSTFRANGGVTIYGYNEGGVVYFETCAATISASLFERNVAFTGGALQMYSQATINVVDCVFQHNFAATDGGAVAQANGTLLLHQCLFFNNSALALGGALFLADAAAVAWDNTSIVSNSAVRGGGVYLGDAASLAATDGLLRSNHAKMGGGVYSTGQATVAVAGVQIVDNNASSTGGGFYMNSTSGVSHTSLACSGNAAALGSDVFWRYDEATPVYACAGCAFAATASLATDPMNITTGWWPPNVTSGVLMTTNASNVDQTLWNPNASTTPWPTILTVDYYGARSVLDGQTTCRLYKDLRETYAIDFTPAGQIAASAGFVTFAQAQVAATAKSSAFHFDAACTLYNDRQLAIDIYIQVNPCNPGYSLNAGKCIPCPQGSFSLDGISCHPCPMGATCLQSTVVGTGVAYTGVDYPSTQQGFFLNDAPASKMGALCDDESAFARGDPCPGGTPETRLERIRSCLNASTFESYWPSERIFTCSSGYNFYTCSVASACKANVGHAFVNSPGAKCAAGFRNVLCSSCDPGFEKLADGSCTVCTPEASSAFYGYLLLPVLFVAAAISGAFLYLRAGTDSVLMAQAKAAKADKPFAYSLADSDAPTYLERFVLRPVSDLWKRVSPGRKLTLRATPANLFQIKRLRPPAVSVNPEKFKILVSFFQIFASFKDTYDIEWPSDVAVFMQFFLKFNFSFLAIPHIDCVWRYNFYVDFELTLGITAILFVLLYGAYRIGVLLYRRKLHRVPRHCPRCGLPNFDIITETAHVAPQPLTRLERLHRLVFEKHAAAPLLPTYAATHTQCPTTHVLESEAIRRQVIRTNLRLWQARLRLRLNFQTYCNKCWKIFFWLALVFYPAVSKKILDLFNCLEIGAGFHLVADMDYLCYSSEWYLRAAVGALGCVGWILGVPLTCFLILLRERHNGVRAKMKQLRDGKHDLARAKWIDAMKIDYEANGLHWDERNMAFADDLLSRYMMKRNLRNPSVVAGVGFIYHAYKDEFWFFEIVDLVRKLFMNGVIVFVGQGSIAQVVVGLIIIFIYMSILLAVQPYKEGSNNAVAAMAQMQLFVTLFAGLLVRMNVGNARSLNLDQVAAIIVVSNCTTISLILFGVLLEKVKEARLHRRICRRKYHDDVRFHIERLWWRATSFALADAYLAKVRTTGAPLPSFRVVLELARRQKAIIAVDSVTTEVRDAEPAT
ncbi:hypothetical protein SPRG_05384 [Saprolegnia parasitica CBS 223.65]|uniref:Protein-tyrosine-phosphatase n=1 Tax=Saprolegnia parasitica (strain CBS 223.65) TaxID=695850 RepID=A0A067CRJ7_SAPPC|nr:hypothetical protein SPRG_05384 [Saprolegnia parasitica CBS 223.65]KDO29141.1 hypothetical protein SPRG_05384 [Saprolegnia parasitica CBS 223.65]|eukprot:XP_012200021.1 hypothetical protein SPRG_05384 [Saprolegnia parasitica CBS 223.65]